ncbi:MAG: hypothetical protein H6747_07990 [Deltaproteobacteria bacterium]|nr:hypothetical protein [Deltaproteobacteria bacterium]
MNHPKRHAVFERASLGTTSSQILAPSSARCSLLLTPHATVTYALRDRPLSTLTDGLIVTPDGGPVLLRCEDFGDMLCHAWHGVANAAIDVSLLVGYVEQDG